MRQIKFRGRKPNGEWLYGDLVHRGGCVFIFPEDGVDSPDNYEVYPDTVGQLTGLTDRNGVDIYEGDVIAVEREFNFKKEHIQHTTIEWSDYGNGMVGWTQFSPPTLWEVVGNIHDNPELLTKKE